MKKAVKKCISYLLTLAILVSTFVMVAPSVEAAELGGLVSGRVYRLRNAQTGMYLNVYGGIDANLTNITMCPKDPASVPDQNLKLEYISGSEYMYRFRAMCSSGGTNRVIDTTRITQNVQLYEYVDPAVEHWKIEHVSGGKYKITLPGYNNNALSCNNSYGTNTGTSTTSTGNVYVKAYTGSNYQLWYFEEQNVGPNNNIISGKVYYLRNKRSGKVLDVCGAGKEERTKVQQYPMVHDPAQRWLVTYEGGGYYRFRAMHTDQMYLDSTSNPVNGAVMQIFSKVICDEQLWKIIPNGEGSYRLSPKYNEYSVCIGIDGASYDSNAKAVSWTYNPSNLNKFDEHWYFDLAQASEQLPTPPANPYAALGWDYFFKGADAKYVGGYRYFKNPANHYGVDVLTPIGVPIYSPCSGIVRNSTSTKPAGNSVYITPDVSSPGHTLDVMSIHMDSRVVVNGQRVAKGQLIGYVGKTGDLANDISHLHFEVSTVGRYSEVADEHVDPQKFFPGKIFTHNGQTP